LDAPDGREERTRGTDARDGKQKADLLAEAGLSRVRLSLDQKSMPSAPWEWAPAHAPLSSFGISATSASVVSMRPATDAAFCRAVRTTLVGSMTPASNRSP